MSHDEHASYRQAGRHMPGGQVVILMGVSGSGKSTVGAALAERLGWRFEDADDHHPAANGAKMGQGIPLTDADRQSWLEGLQRLILEALAQREPMVLACSALKRSHRLMLAGEGRVFVYLKGNPETIRQRMEGRGGHFMKVGMLPSQFAALEEPTAEEAMATDITLDVETIVDTIVDALGHR